MKFAKDAVTLSFSALLFAALFACSGEDPSGSNGHNDVEGCDGGTVYGDEVHLCIYDASTADGDEFYCPQAFPNPFVLMSGDVACSESDELDDARLAVLANQGYEVLPQGGLQICDDPDIYPNHGFSLMEASIDEDHILTLNVMASGSCQPHIWTACWDGAFMESDPVQARLHIRFNSHNDMCEADLSGPRQFDLSEMIEAYESGYQSDSGTIIIHLADLETTLEHTW